MLIKRKNSLTDKPSEMEVNITSEEWKAIQDNPMALQGMNKLTGEEKLFLTLGVNLDEIRNRGAKVELVELDMEPQSGPVIATLGTGRPEAEDFSEYPVCPGCGKRHPPSDDEALDIFGEEVMRKFHMLMHPNEGKIGICQVRDMRTREVFPMLVHHRQNAEGSTSVIPIARMITNAELDAMDARLIDQDYPDEDGEPFEGSEPVKH